MVNREFDGQTSDSADANDETNNNFRRAKGKAYRRGVQSSSATFLEILQEAQTIQTVLRAANEQIPAQIMEEINNSLTRMNTVIRRHRGMLERSQREDQLESIEKPA